MGGRREDVASLQGPAASVRAVGGREVLLLIAGFVLAVSATLAVFLTDNPQYLRLAVIGAAWAFVLAVVAAGRRRADRVAAAAREADLRRSFERELDRERSAHREYELELENELRAEAQEWMRDEMDGLRQEIAALAAGQGDPGGLSVLRDQLASLSGLRDELARLSALRAEVAQLSSLRSDMAALTSLRSDMATLSAMRQELGQLADLRADLNRLRAEVVEQLSGELLVERIIMRTQAARGQGEAESAPGERGSDGLGWGESPPRELTGGWPAIQLDEAFGTREYDRVRADRPAESFGTPPATSAIPLFAETSSSQPWSPQPRSADEPDRYRPAETVESPFARGLGDDEPPRPVGSAQTPLDRLAEHSVIDPVTDLPSHGSRHAARPDGLPEPPQTTEVDAIGVEHPRPQPFPRHDHGFEPSGARRPEPSAYRSPEPSSYRPPVPGSGAGSREPDPARSSPTTAPMRAGEETETGPVWVSEIVAANGGPPRPSGRRRRRYRDDGTEDDVLSRVLRGD